MVSSINGYTSDETEGATYYTSPKGFKIEIKNDEGKGTIEWNEYLYMTKLYSSSKDSTVSIEVSYSYK